MIEWNHWHNEPLLVGGLILLGWIYALLAGPLRPWLAPGAEWPRRHAVRFYGALLVFYLAVGSPLDQAGERFLLTAHMVQHQLLTFAAASLFLLGLPDWMVRPVTGRAVLRPLLRLFTHPLVCGAIYCVVMTAWHAPLLYDLALQNRTLHIAEHFMFFGCALFFWWPLLSPSREFPPVRYAWQMFYLVAVTIGMTPVFAYITFSSDVLYPTYEFAPRITSLTPLQDQVLAGALMKLVGMSVMMMAFGAAFYRWYRESERPDAHS